MTPADIKKFVLEGTPDDVIARYASLPQLARESDFGEYDTNIVVIDTETTGVSLKKNELTQIAAARLEHGEITEWYITFVNPGHEIPEEIVHLTNITEEDVADAPTPEEALAGLVEFVGDAKCVAHNAYFDYSFVTKHPQGYPLLENQWIDSLEIARIALPKMRSHRLIDLVKAFGAPLSTHRADDDVVSTCALYRILLAAVASMPEALLTQISTLAPRDEWPFGAIYPFFAERARATRELAELSEEERAIGRIALPEQFSLGAMRDKRISQVDLTPRRDAATLFNKQQLERAQQHGTQIRMQSGDELETISFPSEEAVEDCFSRDGMMGRIYPDYEQRAEQLKMALAVRDAFENSENLVVEAGTGTGKSMAYLVPSVLTALENNIGIGIATKTNALLDQLVYKELPALAEALAGGEGAGGEGAGGEEAANDDAEAAPAATATTAATTAAPAAAKPEAGMPLTFAPLKGFTHYPCLLKVQRILREGPRMVNVGNEEVSQAPALAALLSFMEQTAYGDMDNLKIDYRSLPRGAVCNTSADCLRRRCPFYGTQCFVFGSRKLAECSDIVVTNHSLLFNDAAADNQLLPPLRYWVVDEAHGAEDEARRALSVSINMDSLARLARRVSAEDAKTNVFIQAERKAPEDNPDETGTLFHGLIAKARAAGQLFADAQQMFESQTRELLYFDPQKKSSYETFDLWLNAEVRASSQFQIAATYAGELQAAAEKLINRAQEIVAIMDDFKGVAFAQREVASVVLELKEVVGAIETIFVRPNDAYVYSVTLNRREGGAGRKPGRGQRRGGNVYHAQYYNVGSALDETLYANTRSVVFTSATLAVNGSFAPFEASVGLNASEQSRAKTLMLESSFDFDNNMRIFVVSDMPEPKSQHYADALAEFLADAHIAQQGSMLTLFTNKKEMDTAYKYVYEALQGEGLRLLCQSRGVSTKAMIDEFCSNETASLFALKSFWEGFDAPGATLRGVTVTKLPFKSPTDPLSQERKFRDDNAWRTYDLPRAVIELRQAAGRLIRKATDEGVLVLCDSRLLSMSYGKVFLNSLPSSNIRAIPAEEIVHTLSL